MRAQSILTLAILTALLAKTSGPLSAQQQGHSGPVLFFGNGVMTSEFKARESADELKELFKAQHFPELSDEAFDRQFSFEVAYNQTGCTGRDGFSVSCLLDLRESVQQAAQERGITFTDTAFWLLKHGIRSGSVANLATTFAAILAVKVVIFSPNDVTDSDLDEQVARYEDIIDTERRGVVLVPHSQGNFFGNQVYDRLSPSTRTGFRMVSVATPANHVAGDGPYTTMEQDFIHHVPSSLAPNVSSDSCGTFLTCHEFQAYLGDEAIRNKILDDMLAQLESLVDSCSAAPDTVVVLDNQLDVLLTIDPSTAGTIPLLALSHGELSGLAFDRRSGKLYSVDQGTNELVEIDLRTNIEQAVGPVGITTVQDLTFGPNNVLYGLANGCCSNGIFIRINTVTGAGTQIGEWIGGQPEGVAYDRTTSRMYVVSRFGPGSLHEIDPTTGETTFVSFGGLTGVSRLADQPETDALYALQGRSFGISGTYLGTLVPGASFAEIGWVGRNLVVTGVEMVPSTCIGPETGTGDLLREDF